MIAAINWSFGTLDDGRGNSESQGRSRPSPQSPSQGLPLKAPPMVVNGLKWGRKAQTVAAVTFAAIYETRLGTAAKACSDTMRYMPWIFQKTSK